MVRSALPPLILAAVVSLVAASSAAAGVYQVRACDAANGLNNSWQPFASPKWVLADEACPSSGQSLRGLSAHNVISHKKDGRTVKRGTAAGFNFSAPPGTSIVGLRAGYRLYRAGSGWRASLGNLGDVVTGCVRGKRACEKTATNRYIAMPPSRTLAVGIYCRAARCPVETTHDPRHGSLQALAALYSAVVTLRDDSRPSITDAGGSLWTDGWHRGTLGVGFNASDNSGVSALQVASEDDPLSQAIRRCDFTRVIPCPQGGSNFSIDTSIIKPDGPHMLSLKAVDAAGNPAIVRRQGLVDNTAPGPPQALTVDGGAGWHRANGFTLRWTSPPADAGAPVDGVLYEVCPADGGPCEQSVQDGEQPTSLTALSVPGPGEWTARVWLRDAAGNADPLTAVGSLPLRFDDEAPHAAFLPQNPRNPTQVAVDATDQYSGVASGTIEIKKSDRAAWHPVPTQLRSTGLVGTIDDTRLANGVYQLRTHVVDQAGNETSTDSRSDGSKATLSLPLRLETRLRTGAIRHVRGRHGKRRRVLRSARVVRFGKSVRVGGVLTSADGTPIVGADVVVQARTDEPGATWTPLALLRTSQKGRFWYVMKRGPSRAIRFHYAGTPTVRAIDSEMTLRVRSRTSLRTNHRHLRNGQAVRFSGRLRGGHVPSVGKLVELQVRLRRRWQTFATFHTGRAGRWRYDYRFIGTSGRVTYVFRAKVPREATYPYYGGSSRHVTVTVRG